METLNKITYIGIGVMGKYMAVHLNTNENIELKIWNRNKQSEHYQYALDKGCRAETELEQAIGFADILCFCVTDAQALKSILWDENIIPLLENKIIIDFSSIGKESTVEIVNQLPKSCHFIDSPVTGGDIGAKNATLTLMIGGDKAIFEQMKFIFYTVGEKVFYVGELGSGQALKSINQLFCTLHLIALCEGFTLADKNNIDTQMLVDVVSSGAGGSWALTNLGAMLNQGNLEPGFMLQHLIKDVNILKNTVDKLNLELPGFEQAKINLEKTYEYSDQSILKKGTQALLKIYKKLNS